MNTTTIIPDLHVKFGEKTWKETFQLVRRCMDKARDKTKPCEPLVRCLERLQALNVFSLNAMMSHLEKIAKQRGVGFHFSEATCYLTADLFYLEVALSPQGGVQDVKVAPHGQPPMSSDSLLMLLRSKNFVAFSKKLAGFAALYNMPGDDSEVKMKLFTALQCLGRDLQKISQLPRSIKEYNSRVDTILNGRIGFLTEGKEDCPLTIQFYVSPADVLKASCSKGCDMEEVGHAGQVMVVLSHVVHSLQMASLLPVPPELDTQGNPVFIPLSEIPSESFPACFVLRLHPPLPMFSSFLNKIGQITDVAIPDVDLQAWDLPALRGAVVGSLLFSHPGHIPAILAVLRHQGAVNTLLASCVGPRGGGGEGGSEDSLLFEVLMQSETSLAVTFQRPDGDSLAILAVEVPDSGELRCSLFTAGTREVSLEEYACRVINRCMSIPVTMRVLCTKMEKTSSCSSSSLAPPPLDLLLPHHQAQTGSDPFVASSPIPASSETLLVSHPDHCHPLPTSLPPDYVSHNAPGLEEEEEEEEEDSQAGPGSDNFTGAASTPERVAEVPMTTSPSAAAAEGVYSNWMTASQ
ncbi:hypothetical protein NHX12_021776 [Muraenolepis orangiensis]|uniref:Mediator of RNA polymerase II transcription subunit 1 n=1 Tax=Muraenolepis orangiensis TaxID=630683 RepID=A0A9Q0EWD2_9TELE|nr:hypothetical protein NHX12_021776 [Muraenolepis orangiensis]